MRLVAVICKRREWSHSVFVLNPRVLKRSLRSIDTEGPATETGQNVGLAVDATEWPKKRFRRVNRPARALDHC